MSTLRQDTEALLSKLLKEKPNDFESKFVALVQVCEHGTNQKSDRLRVYRLLALCLEKLASQKLDI